MAERLNGIVLFPERVQTLLLSIGAVLWAAACSFPQLATTQCNISVLVETKSWHRCKINPSHSICLFILSYGIAPVGTAKRGQRIRKVETVTAVKQTRKNK
jgi:hypothetical protein